MRPDEVALPYRHSPAVLRGRPALRVSRDCISEPNIPARTAAAVAMRTFEHGATFSLKIVHLALAWGGGGH